VKRECCGKAGPWEMTWQNAFLHSEEVYMEVPPGMAVARNGGKVCKLKKKSLYILKQSIRA
jgi:hypothetical protein